MRVLSFAKEDMPLDEMIAAPFEIFNH